MNEVFFSMNENRSFISHYELSVFVAKQSCVQYSLKSFQFFSMIVDYRVKSNFNHFVPFFIVNSVLVSLPLLTH